MGDSWTATGVLIKGVTASGSSGSEATKSLRESANGASLYVWFGCEWCARADAIFDVADMHLLDVEIDDQQRLVLTIESCQMEAAPRPVVAIPSNRRDSS